MVSRGFSAALSSPFVKKERLPLTSPKNFLSRLTVTSA